MVSSADADHVYLCDLLLSVQTAEKWFSWILKYNPLYCTIDVFRSGMFGEPMNLHYAAYALVFSLVTIAIGMFCFKKKQDEFILYI